MGDVWREQLVALAREAGAEATHYETWGDVYELDMELLERFAALVAAHEREACAKVCDKIERHKWEILTQGGKLEGLSPRDCAAAIRNRSNK